jgi:carboxymethylenebutenolidase
MTRLAFVGLSAAATTGLAAAADVTVPEDDPSIVHDRVELRRPDAAIPAYAAWPLRTAPNLPSVVVVMHVWGVDASIRDVVRRLAKAGFAAIAPDLYARFGAPSGDGITDSDTFRPFRQQLDRKQYDGDIRAAALWLTTKFSATKTAVLGFCMGGHIALIQAIDNGDVFSAVVPFYGSLTDIDPDKIHIPLCGSYGARDTSIPADDVRAFRTALRVPNDIRIYNTAGHAFMDDQRAAYVPAAAADAWKRTVDFLTQYLGGNE